MLGVRKFMYFVVLRVKSRKMTVSKEQDYTNIIKYPVIIDKYEGSFFCSTCRNISTPIYYRFSLKEDSEVRGHWICKNCLRRFISILISECDIFPGKEM